MRSKMITGKIRKWGNSMGLLLSKKALHEFGLKENEDVELEVHRKVNPLQELQGALKFTKSTKQLLKEAREGFSKWGL